MLKVTMKSKSVAELLIYGDIGPDWFGEGITDASVAEAIAGFGPVDAIDVHINSCGGDAFHGIAINRILTDAAPEITTYVDGWACSAASVIAMAGDTIVMAEPAMMMIHDASAAVYGNPEELRQAAEMLDKLSGTIAKLYADRSGMSESAARDAMRAETWYTAKEALVAGLADKIAPNKGVSNAAETAPTLNAQKHRFKNAPKPIARRSEQVESLRGEVARQQLYRFAGRA